MPREHRKRGKKHKKTPEDNKLFQEDLNTTYSKPEGEPSWLHPAPENLPEINIEAPFGYVDADVKAYFRTVDDQIRDWQEADERRLTEEVTDPNERTPCQTFTIMVSHPFANEFREKAVFCGSFDGDGRQGKTTSNGSRMFCNLGEDGLFDG